MCLWYPSFNLLQKTEGIKERIKEEYGIKYSISLLNILRRGLAADSGKCIGCLQGRCLHISWVSMFPVEATETYPMLLVEPNRVLGWS